jgi:hypothetical protein
MSCFTMDVVGETSLNRTTVPEGPDVAWLSGMATKKKPGLWANIQKKRKRIEQGSGEHMRKKGERGAPSARSLRKAQAGSRRNKKSA